MSRQYAAAAHAEQWAAIGQWEAERFASLPADEEEADRLWGDASPPPPRLYLVGAASTRGRVLRQKAMASPPGVWNHTRRARAHQALLFAVTTLGNGRGRGPLTQTGRDVLQAHLRRIWFDQDEHQHVNPAPSVFALADLLGRDPRTILRARRELARLGLVTLGGEMLFRDDEELSRLLLQGAHRLAADRYARQIGSKRKRGTPSLPPEAAPVVPPPALDPKNGRMSDPTFNHCGTPSPRFGGEGGSPTLPLRSDLPRVANAVPASGPRASEARDSGEATDARTVRDGSRDAPAARARSRGGESTTHASAPGARAPSTPTRTRPAADAVKRNVALPITVEPERPPPAPERPGLRGGSRRSPGDPRVSAVLTLRPPVEEVRAASTARRARGDRIYVLHDVRGLFGGGALAFGLIVTWGNAGGATRQRTEFFASEDARSARRRALLGRRRRSGYLTVYGVPPPGGRSA